MAPYAQIDSLCIKGVPHEKIITQFNIVRDSLEIWINDPKEQPDTLFLNVNYLKTDTLGLLNSFTEEIKLTKPRKTAAAKTSKKDIKKEDTTAVFTVDAKPENIEQYGFVLEFKYPLVESAFDSLTFRSINPRQQEAFGKYTVEQDSLNLRKYIVRPEEKLQTGYEYFLKIPHRKFMVGFCIKSFIMAYSTWVRRIRLPFFSRVWLRVFITKGPWVRCSLLTVLSPPMRR